MMNIHLETRTRDQIGLNYRKSFKNNAPCILTNLASSTVARPVIPKRGEKDFEPNVSGGSGLQRHVLDGARSAMFDALKTTRTTSSYVVHSAASLPGLMVTEQ